jgi:hypothetical protein
LLGLLASLLFTRPALAAKDVFELTTRTTRPPEMGEVTWYDLSSRLGDFSFMPPPGWRLQVNKAAKRFSFQAPNLDGQIEVVFAGVNPALLPTPDQEALKQQAQDRFTNSTVREQFTCHTSGFPGHAIDVDWKPAKDVRMAVRLVQVPLPGGTLEFCLTSPPDKAASYRYVLGALLTSFSASAPKESGSSEKASQTRQP